MKPTILLIHGSMHDTSTWDLIIPKLEALSYPSSAIQLPTSNPSKPNLTPYDDAAAIHEVMIQLLDDGKEVVIIAHSYGAVPSLLAIEGHEIVARKEKGLEGGVKSFMAVSSVLISEKGKTCAETHYDAASDWGDLDFEAGLVKPNAKAGPNFYNDLSAEEVQKREKVLRPHALSAFMTPIQYSVNDLRCPFFYTMCENDAVVFPHQQERMVGAVKSARIEKISTGHSPMISRPDEFVKIVEKVAAASLILLLT